MMRKLLLMFIAGAMTTGASAQERHMLQAAPAAPGVINATAASVRSEFGASRVKKVKKTTAATSRWYSYVDYYDTSLVDAAGAGIALSAPYLWNDTMSQDAYGGATAGTTTYSHNRTVSMGSILDPTFKGLNNYSYYPGEMKLTATNAYTLDSLVIFGVYGRNPAKLSVVDTLRISLLYGDGTTSSDIPKYTTTNASVLTRYGASPNLKYAGINYDTVTNTAKGTTVVTKTILLDTAALRLDTSSNGTFAAVLGFPAINIPAGNMVSATISFKSGDPTFTAHDTVFKSNGTTGTYKYNMFRPYVAHNGTAATPQFAPYDSTNFNTGVFKTLPDTANGWGGRYIPLWFWSSTSGSTSQFPYMRFHLNCATCSTILDPAAIANVSGITNVTTYPTPANTELNVPFTVAETGQVTVTLSNIVGQVVATRDMGNVTSGKAVFNTTALPAGIYVYSVIANGERSSGRVSIAH